MSRAASWSPVPVHSRPAPPGLQSVRQHDRGTDVAGIVEDDVRGDEVGRPRIVAVIIASRDSPPVRMRTAQCPRVPAGTPLSMTTWDATPDSVRRWRAQTPSASRTARTARVTSGRMP